MGEVLLAGEKVKKSKTKPTLESIFFSTPEQRLMRFLLSEPTTAFTPRVLSSKLKGIRGLGGSEGIQRILNQLHEVGLVQFVNHNREVCLENDALPVKLMKVFGAICDLEGLGENLKTISEKGVLFGSRCSGLFRSDSDYDLLVVSSQGEEVKKIVTRHPLGKRITLQVWNNDDFMHVEKRDPKLARKIETGIVLWGMTW